MTVVRMQSVLTQTEASPAPVEMGTLEMELFAPVRKWLFYDLGDTENCCNNSSGLDVAR